LFYTPNSDQAGEGGAKGWKHEKLDKCLLLICERQLDYQVLPNSSTQKKWCWLKCPL